MSLAGMNFHREWMGCIKSIIRILYKENQLSSLHSSASKTQKSQGMMLIFIQMGPYIIKQPLTANEELKWYIS